MRKFVFLGLLGRLGAHGRWCARRGAGRAGAPRGVRAARYGIAPRG